MTIQFPQGYRNRNKNWFIGKIIVSAFSKKIFAEVQYYNENLRLFSASEKIVLRKDVSFQSIFINSDHIVVNNRILQQESVIDIAFTVKILIPSHFLLFLSPWDNEINPGHSNGALNYQLFNIVALQNGRDKNLTPMKTTGKQAFSESHATEQCPFFASQVNIIRRQKQYCFDI